MGGYPLLLQTLCCKFRIGGDGNGKNKGQQSYRESKMFSLPLLRNPNPSYIHAIVIYTTVSKLSELPYPGRDAISFGGGKTKGGAPCEMHREGMSLTEICH